MERILKNTLVNGIFGGVQPKRSAMMKSIKGKGNKSTEISFRLALAREKISGWITHVKMPGQPDIFFPDYKIAIFLDGCFWHGCPECGHIPKTNSLYWKTKFDRNIQRDISNTEKLKHEGITVIRFWEHELKHNINDCATHVGDVIEKILMSD